MKTKRTRAFIVAFATLLLTSLSITGCGSGCCPSISGDDTFVEEDLICSPVCPEGGKTKLHYTIEFTQNGEPCTPNGFRIYIRNVTEGTDLPPLVVPEESQIGVYTGEAELELQDDTEFELRAEGGDGNCGQVKKTFEINVVHPQFGDVYTFCFAREITSWPSSDPGWNADIRAGAGILVTGIENRNDFSIHVLHDTLVVTEIAPNSAISIRDEVAAAGAWRVEIPSEGDFSKYRDQIDGGKPVCVNWKVSCDCAKVEYDTRPSN